MMKNMLVLMTIRISTVQHVYEIIHFISQFM